MAILKNLGIHDGATQKEAAQKLVDYVDAKRALAKLPEADLISCLLIEIVCYIKNCMHIQVSVYTAAALPGQLLLSLPRPCSSPRSSHHWCCCQTSLPNSDSLHHPAIVCITSQETQPGVKEGINSPSMMKVNLLQLGACPPSQSNE